MRVTETIVKYQVSMAIIMLYARYIHYIAYEEHSPTYVITRGI